MLDPNRSFGSADIDFIARGPLEALSIVQGLLEQHSQWVDEECIGLYAGTNYPGGAWLKVAGERLGIRPSLGDPGNKYETGLKFSDEIETITVELLKKLFRAKFVEIRVLSGSMANLYAYMALTEPYDHIMSVPTEYGGHATHHAHGAAGLYRLKIYDIPFETATMNIHPERFRALAKSVRPRLIMLGSSLPLFPYDLKMVREVADDIGAYVVYDAAHVAGLVAAGQFQNPLQEGADLVTMSTYKTFGGPPGGLILTNRTDVAERIRAVAYPGLTANFDMGRVAALAVAAAEVLASGVDYARRCIENGAVLSQSLLKEGLPVIAQEAGMTRSHVVAFDAWPFGGGTRAARYAEQANILFSGIPLPLEEIPNDYNGVRLGVQEVTRLGMGPSEMNLIARFLRRLLVDREDLAKIRQEVIEFRRNYPEPGH